MKQGVITPSSTGSRIVQNGNTLNTLHRTVFPAYNYGTASYTYIKRRGVTVFLKNTCTNNHWQVLYNFGAIEGLTVLIALIIVWAKSRTCLAKSAVCLRG